MVSTPFTNRILNANSLFIALHHTRFTPRNAGKIKFKSDQEQYTWIAFNNANVHLPKGKAMHCKSTFQVRRK
ncbi:hypothetical protein XF_2600 [Xylella fastidiosa 9a5c]|uniref:Uncharacterized protein n=1 Tax=Xylella fastidiosa (strain 9a5c) TaxID=160492 RepID=Q9PAB8_XYLFA|nr:hypothetical protein XF_2600 [Xylella fastidiosa 9a5c]